MFMTDKTKLLVHQKVLFYKVILGDWITSSQTLIINPAVPLGDLG